MRIIDASSEQEHFFVRVTDDGRLLRATAERLPDPLEDSERRFFLKMRIGDAQ